MSSGFEVRGLDPVARTLADGGTGLNELAATAPEVPDAGESSADIAGALAAIFNAASMIVRSAAAADERVRSCAAAYQENELLGASRFGGWPR
jgi:hypothetical protein